MRVPAAALRSVPSSGGKSEASCLEIVEFVLLYLEESVVFGKLEVVC